MVLSTRLSDQKRSEILQAMLTGFDFQLKKIIIIALDSFAYRITTICWIIVTTFPTNMISMN